MRRLVLTVMTFLALTATAAAQNLEVSVAVVATQKQPMTVGDMVHLTVTVTNTGDKAAEGLKELVFDRQSVVLECSLAGSKTFTDERIGESIFKPLELEKFKLEPKKSKSLALTVPLLMEGELKVTALYKGGAKLVRSKPLSLKAGAKDGMKVAKVRIYTNRGVIVLRLFPLKALGTCHHFARHINQGFYNGLIFHRIIRNFVIQGGCPNGNGMGGPGYNIPGEINDMKHLPGRLAMAHSGNASSAGSQFYICTAPRKSLDGKYTVFGEVVEGMDVVELHGRTKTGAGDRPEKIQRIRHVELIP